MTSGHLWAVSGQVLRKFKTRNIKVNRGKKERTFAFCLIEFCVLSIPVLMTAFSFKPRGVYKMGRALHVLAFQIQRVDGVHGPLHFPCCFEHVFSLVLPNSHLLVANNILGSVLSIWQYIHTYFPDTVIVNNLWLRKLKLV